MEQIRDLLSDTVSLWRLNTLKFLILNRAQVARASIAAALLLIAQIAFFLFLLAEHPAAGYIVQNTAIRLGLWFTNSLILLSLLVFVALFIRTFGSGIRFEAIEISPVKLLAGSNWQEPDIYPDRLICLRPGESREDFLARWQEAEESARPESWVVVIPFRVSAGVLYGEANRGKEFFRDRPPCQDSENWQEEDLICPPGFYFRGETQAEYQRYLSRFAMYFPEWSARKKVSGEQSLSIKISAIRQQAANALATFALILLSTFAAAQGSIATMEAALGTGIRDIPDPGSSLQFIFEGDDINLTAPGGRTYTQILRDLPAFNERRAGSFVALLNGQRVVARANRVEQVATKAAPAEISAPPRAEPALAIAVPDSFAVADQINQIRDKIPFYETQFWIAIKPAWGLVMAFFWAFFVPLFIAAGVLWLWADLAREEEMPRIHFIASRGLLIILGFKASIFIINSALSLVWLECPVWALVAAMIPVVILTSFAVRKMIPTIRARFNGRTAYTGRSSNLPAVPE